MALLWTAIQTIAVERNKGAAPGPLESLQRSVKMGCTGYIDPMRKIRSFQYCPDRKE